MYSQLCPFRRCFQRYNSGLGISASMDRVLIIGEWLKNDDDVEYCCWKVLKSEVFQKNSNKARYQLINIANEVSPSSVSQAIPYLRCYFDSLLGMFELDFAFRI